MQNLKTVDFGVAFTLTRPAPADYEDKDGNTQTAAANEPRFNYSNGVARGLLLDASLSETAAIDDVPLFNSSAGHWIIDAEFYNSEPLKGMGLDEVFAGSGKMVVSYSGGTAKVWAGGQAIYTVASYTPAEPTHICEGGMASIGGLTYKPSEISDADAAALATGGFEVAFAPDELFANGEQGAWYDPSDLTTLFQDAAGTIPVTADGDPVGLILDKSGNDNHAVQSTTSAKITYRTDGTLHWLEGDGVDDHLVTDMVGFTSDLYIASAASLSSGGGTFGGPWRFLRSGGDPSSVTDNFLEEYSQRGSMVRRAIYARYPAQIELHDTNDRPAAGVPHVSWLNHSAGSLRVGIADATQDAYVDKSAPAVGNGDAVLSLFRGYQGDFLQGKMYGFIWVSGGIESGEQEQAKIWMATKAGVTLP